MAQAHAGGERKRDQRALALDPAGRLAQIGRRGRVDAVERDPRRMVEAQPRLVARARDPIIDARAPVEHEPAVAPVLADAQIDARGLRHGRRRPFRRRADQVDDDRLFVDEAAQPEPADEGKARGLAVGFDPGVAQVAAEPAPHRVEVGLDRPVEGDAERAILDPRAIGDRLGPVEDDASETIVNGGAQARPLGRPNDGRNEQGERTNQRERDARQASENGADAVTEHRHPPARPFRRR